jgi:hypothetical protein
MVSWFLSSRHVPQPPVEPGSGADEIAACLESATALGLRVFGRAADGNATVGQHCIGQWSDLPGWLQIEVEDGRTSTIGFLGKTMQSIPPISVLSGTLALLTDGCTGT